jgi:hypothetical protein
VFRGEAIPTPDQFQDRHSPKTLLRLRRRLVVTALDDIPARPQIETPTGKGHPDVDHDGP